MTKYAVKKIENTNTMTTTLTTSCKKRDTAINRFCRFLSEYDSCFKDSLLIATTHICYAGDYNNIVYKSVSESDEYILTYTEYAPTDNDKNNVVFTVIIEFKHDDNTTHYKSLANTSVSCSTKENGSETTNNEESDNITPQPCHIKAYYDGKEFTVPYDKYKCRQYAVEYIKALYENHVVEYETLFFIYYGKHVETMTIENVLDVVELIECNIDNINDGLKTDCYKKVREGFVNLCSLITDNKVIIELITLNTSRTYTITKSRFEDLYTFESDTMRRIQSPESFARWLYWHSFTHKIILNYAEGESK